MNITFLFLVIAFMSAASIYSFFMSLVSCFFMVCQTPATQTIPYFLTDTPKKFQLLSSTSHNIVSVPLSTPVPDTVISQANKKLKHHNEKKTPNTLRIPDPFANNLQVFLHSFFQSQKTLTPTGWEHLKPRFERLSITQQTDIADFYAQKFYQPVWFNPKGILTQNAKTTQTLLNDEIHFTTPIINPFLPKIPVLHHKTIDNDKILQKDFEFTLNLLSALNLIRNGITHLKLFGIPENALIKPFDFQHILTEFLNGNIQDSLLNVTSFNPQYALLKHHIQNLNDLQNNGGYQAVPYGDILNQGMTGSNVPAIRKRLSQLGFIVNNLDSKHYDIDLEKQIIAFQISRGIEAEGIINHATYQALENTVTDDLKTLLVNMERIRHSADARLYEKYVTVNIPEMTLKAYHNANNTHIMRTIVGRPDRKTPVFNDKIDYVDFYPYWHIPYSLATKDILPKLKKNRHYITTHHIKIFRGDTLINPEKIAWHTYSERNFPFTLRQDPSINNALGTVKFMFPNHHAVYLHDTPTKNIFNKNSRSESSGCVRVSNPKELAYFLLENKMTKANIDAIFKNGKNKAIRLPYQVPISMEYHTAFVTDNILHIRPDIYGYDENLFNQLLIELQTKDN